MIREATGKESLTPRQEQAGSGRSRDSWRGSSGAWREVKWRRKHAVGLLDGESRKEKKLLASLHLAGENGLRGEEKGDWPCLREGIKQRAEVLQLAACSPLAHREEGGTSCPRPWRMCTWGGRRAAVG